MKTLFKAAITVLLLVLMFRLVDVRELGGVVKGMNVAYLLPAVLAQAMSTAIAAYRYRLIMRNLEFKEGAGFFFRSYFKGAFLNQTLPGSIGGDAMRVIELGRIGYRKRDAFYGVFIDRIAGLVGLLLLNVSANNLSPGLLPAWLFNLINLICLVGIAGVFVLLHLHRLHWLDRFHLLRPFHVLSQQFQRAHYSLPATAKLIGLSVVNHIFPIIALFVLARAIGLDVGLMTLMVVIPPVFLLAQLPISLAGWGVREGAMVGILMLIGIPKAPILTLSLLYGLTLILASLPGLYFLIRSHDRR